jgi:hypothetical protein
MNKLRALVSLLVLTLAACTSNVSDGNPGTSSGSTPPASGGLAGSYSGTYQGDASGPVTMTIAGDTIDVVVTVAGTKYPASGQLSGSGGLSVGIGTGNGVTVTFEGTFAGSKGSGTWSSSVATKGTWSVSK